MKKKEKLIEPEDRHCPICDDKIKKGSRLHRCSKRKLKQVENIIVESQVDIEEERTYNDKMSEFEEYFNNNTYYDDNIEER